MSLLKTIVSRYPLPSIRIGDKEASVAIVQGGMGVGISLSSLAAAVAREGGVGVIAANAIGMTEADSYDDPAAANVRALRREIQAARRKSAGLLGVNIMVAVDCFHELLDAAVEEKADILFLGAGLPIKGIPVGAIRDAGVRVMPIVSSGRAAGLIFKAWEKHYGDIPDGESWVHVLLVNSSDGQSYATTRWGEAAFEQRLGRVSPGSYVGRIEVLKMHSAGKPAREVRVQVVRDPPYVRPALWVFLYGLAAVVLMFMARGNFEQRRWSVSDHA